MRFPSVIITLSVAAWALPSYGQEDFGLGREALRAAEEERAILQRTADQPFAIPYLYEGELEDVGPQFLLVPGRERHRWFQLVFDSQWFYNSNPTLADSANRIDTDVWVNTLELRAKSPKREIFGGEMELAGGAWAQSYFYGAVSGPTRQAGGLDINDFNFTGITFFSEADYQRGPSFAAAGLRWTRLSNTSGDNGFYREWVPSWRVGHRFSLSQRDLLTVRYDGSYHATTLETFAFLRDDLNDRWSNSGSIIWTRLLAPGWFLQTYGAAIHETYTRGPDRNEWTYVAGGALIRQFNARLAARVFISYAMRDSNRPEFADYRQLTSGLGGSLSFRF